MRCKTCDTEITARQNRMNAGLCARCLDAALKEAAWLASLREAKRNKRKKA